MRELRQRANSNITSVRLDTSIDSAKKPSSRTQTRLMVTVIGLLCSLVLLVQNELFNIGHNRRPWCDYLSSNPIVSNTDARTYVPDVHMFNWTSVRHFYLTEPVYIGITVRTIQIIPSEKLVWTRCYAKFECARLSVRFSLLVIFLYF